MIKLLARWGSYVDFIMAKSPTIFEVGVAGYGQLAHNEEK